MNTYILSEHAINAIVVFSNKTLGIACDPQPFGQHLWNVNVSSVNKLTKQRQPNLQYSADLTQPPVSPIYFLRLLACLQEQSAGYPGYYEKKVYEVTEQLRLQTIPLLPGYDNNKHNINERDIVKFYSYVRTLYWNIPLAYGPSWQEISHVLFGKSLDNIARDDEQVVKTGFFLRLLQIIENEKSDMHMLNEEVDKWLTRLRHNALSHLASHNADSFTL